MSTESDVKLARYNEVIKEADEFGRLIGIRRLKPSEQTKVAGMAPELTGYDEMTNDDGKMIRIPHRLPLSLAASVCMIDDAHIPFPRNRGELDAIYDRLDAEGIAAATAAYARLMKFDQNDDSEPREPLDETKNSLGTPSSA